MDRKDLNQTQDLVEIHVNKSYTRAPNVVGASSSLCNARVGNALVHSIFLFLIPADMWLLYLICRLGGIYPLKWEMSRTLPLRSETLKHFVKHRTAAF